MKKSTFFLLLFFTFASCTTDPHVGEGLTVRYGIFLTPCSGYCVREIEITDNRISYTLFGSDQGTYPDTTITAALSPLDQKKVHNSVDLQLISTMPDTIGCPVCPENFGEYVEVQHGNFHRKTVIEAGADVPELEHLLSILRQIHGRFD